MRAAILILCFLLPVQLLAYDGETPIKNTTELKVWCKNKSSEYYLSKGITPYNWTDAWWTEGDFLFVEGEWKVDNNKQTVTCRIRKGVAEKYATMEFINKQ